jgi:hypothetical protein
MKKTNGRSHFLTSMPWSNSIGLINCFRTTSTPEANKVKVRKINIVLGEIENSIKHEKETN